MSQEKGGVSPKGDCKTILSRRPKKRTWSHDSLESASGVLIHMGEQASHKQEHAEVPPPELSLEDAIAGPACRQQPVLLLNYLCSAEPSLSPPPLTHSPTRRSSQVLIKSFLAPVTTSLL
ncbi:hypothetical protein H1C71_034840 [Ictidomys tridecemlineatus]|nr:hypothetical protein H1C71_034840 [Ictidomys tridecemlineatus]